MVLQEDLRDPAIGEVRDGCRIFQAVQLELEHDRGAAIEQALARTHGAALRKNGGMSNGCGAASAGSRCRPGAKCIAATSARLKGIHPALKGQLVRSACVRWRPSRFSVQEKHKISCSFAIDAHNSLC